jgi:MinD-like ATPase involved in chromosome partitioning or flagellar assembly
VRTVVVAGTAGGVGTTTVASLIALVVRASALADHSSGQLVARGAPVDPASPSGIAVHDLGAHAGGVGLESLAAASAIPVIVTSATAAGIADAATALRALVQLPGSRSPLLVVVETFGRNDVSAALRAARLEFGQTTIVVMQQDRALAPGGPITVERTSMRTRHTIERVARRIQEIAAAA